MRKLWPVLLLALAAGVEAGENKLGAGCTLTSTAPTVATSADDTDCDWSSGQLLLIQCSAAVYWSTDGTAPTSANSKLTVGDAYPFRARDRSADGTSAAPVRTLPVTGAATCQIFDSDLE